MFLRLRRSMLTLSTLSDRFPTGLCLCLSLSGNGCRGHLPPSCPRVCAGRCAPCLPSSRHSVTIPPPVRGSSPQTAVSPSYCKLTCRTSSSFGTSVPVRLGNSTSPARRCSVLTRGLRRICLFLSPPISSFVCSPCFVHC